MFVIWNRNKKTAPTNHPPPPQKKINPPPITWTKGSSNSLEEFTN